MEESFYKSVNVDEDDFWKKGWILKKFIKGDNEEISEPEFLQNITDSIKNSGHFLKSAGQNCRNLIISITFQGKSYSFRDFGKNDTHNVGPWPYSTDYGMCCLIMPNFLSFNSDWSDLQHNKSKASNGRRNGLELLLDAEQFNYAYLSEEGVGFKMVLHHHNDKPMFQFSSEFLNVGTSTQINIKPTITYTTNSCISTFSPIERNCYDKGEQILNYLLLEDAYR